MHQKATGVLCAATMMWLTACGDDGNGNPTPTPDANVPQPDAPMAMPDASTPVAPTIYTFPSRFVDGESSVSYSGQVFRQALIVELANKLDGLTEFVKSQTDIADGSIVSELNFYYEFNDTTSATVDLTLTTDPPLQQEKYQDISSDKKLQDKIAGQDPGPQHKDWAAEFVGWNPADASNPDALVDFWFEAIEDLAQRHLSTDNVPKEPDGTTDIAEVYVTEAGQDLSRLLQSFLLVAVNFSQGADDYLDDGLDASNAQSGESPYSSLEHGWDEGFGYFGAARDYNDYSDADIVGKGYIDSDNSNTIDLKSEFNFGPAIQAAARDQDSADTAKTDFTKTIFDAFLQGRHIISSASDPIGDTAKTELAAQRDIIVLNWEKVIAATVIHHLNATLAQMNRIGNAGYDFYAHASDWSAMKGLALGFQFNPASPLTDAKFGEFHTLVGDAPVLKDDDSTTDVNELEVYKTDLQQARGILAEAYEFEAANVGDDNGQNGW